MNMLVSAVLSFDYTASSARCRGVRGASARSSTLARSLAPSPAPPAGPSHAQLALTGAGIEAARGRDERASLGWRAMGERPHPTLRAARPAPAPPVGL